MKIIKIPQSDDMKVEVVELWNNGKLVNTRVLKKKNMDKQKIKVGDKILLQDPINQGQIVNVTATLDNGYVAYEGGVSKSYRKLKPAMKAASKFLQKIFHTDNDAEAMECVAQVVTAEAEGNTDFFISSLDEVIKFCEKLKKDVWNESKITNKEF